MKKNKINFEVLNPKINIVFDLKTVIAFSKILIIGGALLYNFGKASRKN